MRIYTASYAFVADVEAQNDDRETLVVNEEAAPSVFWLWTEQGYPQGFEAAKAEIEQENTEATRGDGQQDPAYRWVLCEEDSSETVTAWDLFDDANDHVRIARLVVVVREAT